MTRTLTRWTLADYHQMITNGLLAGRHVELIDGKIVDMAPEPPIHRATYRHRTLPRVMLAFSFDCYFPLI